MAGRIKEIIDAIVEQRAKGNPALENLTKAKLAMKGVIPEKYTEVSADDPAIIEKLIGIASELNIKV